MRNSWNCMAACFLLTLNTFRFAESATACSPPTLPPNSQWVPSSGCTGAYSTATQRCRCWGHCGYICEPLPSTATTAGSYTPGTCNPNNANGPNLTTGESWQPDPQCTLGGPGKIIFLDNNTERCRCWSYCGYVCEANPLSR